MFNLRRHALVSTLSVLSAGVLFASHPTAAHADDEPAPEAPPNVMTPGPEASSSPGESPRFSDETASSGTSEPSFETETSRMTWPNVPLLATGATVFGLSYAPAAIFGAISDAEDREDLYIPVAGPWMMLSADNGLSGGEKTLLIANGALQGVGALMLLSSFFIPEKTTSRWYLIGSNDVRVAPSYVGTGYGLGAAGRF